MDEAAVLAECAAHPDDDAPRLVWADLVGGERGELVVLQCDLARGGLTPAEVAIRRKRERELLDRHAVAWAGPLARIAMSWSFRRGFIETARLVGHDAAVLAAHPLLATVVLEDMALLQRLRDLRGLGIRSLRFEDTPVFDTLQAIGFELLGSDDVERARAVLRRTRVSHLEVQSQPALEDADLAKLLEAAPFVQTLHLWTEATLRLARPLRGLRANKPSPATLATSRDTLARLWVGLGHVAPRQLLELGQLEVLQMAGKGDETRDVVRVLARAPMLPRLREVRIEQAVEPEALRAFVERYGAQLELLEIRGGTKLPATAIAGELRSVAPTRELLHPDPRAFLALGNPHVPEGHRVAFARVDGTPAVWDLTKEPVGHRLFIGRVVDCHVQVDDQTVSRRQCELLWRGDHHLVKDNASANGICVDGKRVEEGTLVDGSELIAGRVVLRYFVGDGACERAVAAIERARTHDFVTDLPIEPNPPHTIDVTNWASIHNTEGYAREPLLLRALVEELRLYAAGEPITFVQQGIFGVQASAAARVGTRRIVVTIGGHHIALEVVAQ
jgi:uncharacterized protein (TIGR02996 family)